MIAPRHASTAAGGFLESNFLSRKIYWYTPSTHVAANTKITTKHNRSLKTQDTPQSFVLVALEFLLLADALKAHHEVDQGRCHESAALRVA